MVPVLKRGRTWWSWMCVENSEKDTMFPSTGQNQAYLGPKAWYWEDVFQRCSRAWLGSLTCHLALPCFNIKVGQQLVFGLSFPQRSPQKRVLLSSQGFIFKVAKSPRNLGAKLHSLWELGSSVWLHVADFSDDSPYSSIHNREQNWALDLKLEHAAISGRRSNQREAQQLQIHPSKF